jgi:hypothetical protein
MHPPTHIVRGVLSILPEPWFPLVFIPMLLKLIVGLLIVIFIVIFRVTVNVTGGWGAVTGGRRARAGEGGTSSSGRRAPHWGVQERNTQEAYVLPPGVNVTRRGLCRCCCCCCCCCCWSCILCW